MLSTRIVWSQTDNYCIWHSTRPATSQSQQDRVSQALAPVGPVDNQSVEYIDRGLEGQQSYLAHASFLPPKGYPSSSGEPSLPAGRETDPLASEIARCEVASVPWSDASRRCTPLASGTHAWWYQGRMGREGTPARTCGQLFSLPAGGRPLRYCGMAGEPGFTCLLRSSEGVVMVTTYLMRQFCLLISCTPLSPLISLPPPSPVSRFACPYFMITVSHLTSVAIIQGGGGRKSASRPTPLKV